MAIGRPETPTAPSGLSSSIRGRKTSRKSSQSISKINQSIVSSLNTVSESLNRMERSLSSLTRSFTQEMRGMHDEAKKYQVDTSDHIKENSKEAKEAMHEVVRSNEQILSDFERSVRRIGNVMKASIGFFIGTVVIKGIRKLTSFLEFNFFDFMTSRITYIKEMLMTIIPGAEVAVATLRESQDIASQLQQSYGVLNDEGERYIQWTRSASSEVMLSGQLMSAVEAVYATHVRGFDRVIERSEDVAYISAVTGIELNKVAEIYRDMMDVQGLSQEETLKYMETWVRYARNAGQIFELAPGIADMESIFSSTFEELRTLVRFSDDPDIFQNLQRNLLTAGQVAALANVDVGGFLDIITKSFTTESPLLALMNMSLPEAQDLLSEGKVEEFYGNIHSSINDIFQSFEGYDNPLVAAANAINAQLGTNYTVDQLIRIRDGLEDYDKILTVVDQSMQESTGTAGFWKDSLEDIIPIATRMTNRLAVFTDSVKIGNIPLTDILDTITLLEPQMQAIGGAFGVVEQGADMMFGPLSFAVKPLANVLMTLASIGGATTDLTDAQRAGLGPIANYFDLIRGTMKDFLPDIKKMLPEIVGWFEGLFLAPTDGVSLFEDMINRGVDFLTSPEMISETGHITRIFDMLTNVFDVLADQFEQLMSDDNAFGTRLVDFITTMMNGIARVLGSMIRVIVPVVSTMIKLMVDVLSHPEITKAIGDFITTLIESIVDAIILNKNALIEILTPIGDIIWNVIKMGFFGIMTLIAPVIDELTKDLSILGTDLSTDLAATFTMSNMEDWMAVPGGYGQQGTETGERVMAVVEEQQKSGVWGLVETGGDILTGGINLLARNESQRIEQREAEAGGHYDYWMGITSQINQLMESDRPFHEIHSTLRQLYRQAHSSTELGSEAAAHAALLGIRELNQMSMSAMGPSERSTETEAFMVDPWSTSEYSSGAPLITSPFAPRPDIGLGFHKGVDFEMHGGSTVNAIQRGMVDYIGNDNIRILSADGTYWDYRHLDPTAIENPWKIGDTVPAGYPIGEIFGANQVYLDTGKTYWDVMGGESSTDIMGQHLHVGTFVTPNVEPEVGMLQSHRKESPYERYYTNVELAAQASGMDWEYKASERWGDWRGSSLQTTDPEKLRQSQRDFEEWQRTRTANVEGEGMILTATLRTAEAVEELVSDSREKKMAMALALAGG